MEHFFHSDLFAYLILPALIFIARVVDVSIGTIRIILLSKGNKTLAPILGFIEILVWLAAIGQIFRNLNNVMCYVGYAGGFAMGNYVGLIMEEKLAIGKQIVRIFLKDESSRLIEALRKKRFPMTLVDGTGVNGPVKIIFMVVNRKDIPLIKNILNLYQPQVFFTIENIHSARELAENLPYPGMKDKFWQFFRITRKRK